MEDESESGDDHSGVFEAGAPAAALEMDGSEPEQGSGSNYADEGEMLLAEHEHVLNEFSGLVSKSEKLSRRAGKLSRQAMQCKTRMRAFERQFTKYFGHDGAKMLKRSTRLGDLNDSNVILKRLNNSQQKKIASERRKNIELTNFCEEKGHDVPTAMRTDDTAAYAIDENEEGGSASGAFDLWFPDTSGPPQREESRFVVQMTNIPKTDNLDHARRFLPSVCQFPHTFEEYAHQGNILSMHIVKTRAICLNFVLADRCYPDDFVSELQLNPDGGATPLVRFRIDLVYADDGSVVELGKLKHSENIDDVTDPPLAEVNRNLCMRNGKVIVHLKKVNALSSNTSPNHRQMCFVLHCMDEELKVYAHMHARSPAFYSKAKSNMPAMIMHQKGKKIQQPMQPAEAAEAAEADE